jgi:hypothetical protein
MSEKVKTQQAILCGTQYGRLYGRLDSARTLLQQAIDEASPPLQQKDFDQLVRARDAVNGAIGLVLDSARRDAHSLAE